MSKALTDRQERFCVHYSVSLNGAEAARQAGYAEDTADREAWRLLRNVEVRRRVRELIDADAAAIGVDRQYVLNELVRINERAMGRMPNAKGELEYQPQFALRALSRLGKYLGMEVQRHEHSGPDGSPIQFGQKISDLELARRIAFVVARARREQGSVRKGGDARPAEIHNRHKERDDG